MKLTLLGVAVVALAIGFAFTRPATGATTVSVPKCPSHAPKFAASNVPSPHFVRSGAVLIRLCRYYNINWGDSQGLWRHRTIRQQKTLSNLTRAFNRLKAPPRGIFCIKDDGSEMALFFGYAGAKPQRVVVKLSGCRFASNGKAVRSTTAKLHHRLIALSKS